MLRHLSLLCWGPVHKLVGCLMLSHSCPDCPPGRMGTEGWQPGLGIQMLICSAVPLSHLEMCAVFLSPSLKHLCCPPVFYLLSPVEPCDESSWNWVFEEWVPVCPFRIFAAWAEMFRKTPHLFQCGDCRYGCDELLVCLHASVCGCPSLGSGIQSSFDLLSWHL